MTPAEIKVKRTESILKELIPEALSGLNDARLRELDIIDVQCSKGRSDAKIYIDPHKYTEEERRTFLKQLKKARPIIEEHCSRDQGWFRSPIFTFVFDDHLEKSKTIEDLFAKIATRTKKEDDES